MLSVVCICRVRVSCSGDSLQTQVEVILTFEEFCGEEGEFTTDHGASFASIFTQASWGSLMCCTTRACTAQGVADPLPGPRHLEGLPERPPAHYSCVSAASTSSQGMGSSWYAYVQVLKQLYDADILTEDALLAWADEKADASVEDHRFLTLVRR